MKRNLFFVVLTFVLILVILSLSSCMSYSPDEPGGNGYFGEQFGDVVVSEGTGDNFEPFVDNPFVSVSDEPVSTFSVDADGASYAYMRAMVNAQRGIDKSTVRIEEFLNYFTFDYPSPTDGHAVALNAEIGDCPWNEEHKLVRLGIKGKDLTERPQSNYVFLVDVSGSMDSPNKLPLLKKGLLAMLEHLLPTDRLSIVTYSGEVRLALESTLVTEENKPAIREVIKSLVASGSTNGGSAIKMAYEEALSHYVEGGNNRIIMGTDGDFNVGVVGTDALLELVQNYCKQGIYLTVCGFGYGNLNDAMMETVSNKGNGTYVYVDSEEEMMKVFVYETSHFFAVANDCKTQITFDSTMVEQYRLIGYENRVMAAEDFTNDSVDAAEVGAGQTITALYEIVPTAAWTDNTACAVFDFRYKESLSGASVPLSLPVATWVGSESENLRFAAGVAALGMVLRHSPYAGTATLSMATTLVDEARTFDPHEYRAELVSLLLKIPSLNE